MTGGRVAGFVIQMRLRYPQVIGRLNHARRTSALTGMLRQNISARWQAIAANYIHGIGELAFKTVTNGRKTSRSTAAVIEYIVIGAGCLRKG